MNEFELRFQVPATRGEALARALRRRPPGVDAAFDRDPRRALPELVLQPAGGGARGLFALALEWQSAHGLWIAGCGGAAAARAQPPRWTRRQARAMDGVALLRTMVGACLEQIVPEAGALAGGRRDPDHVHQLRVGLRRLRSVARLSPAAGALPAGWEPPVREAFAALGELRDAHVLAVDLLPRLRRAGAPLEDAPAPGPSGAAFDAVAALLRAEPFQRTLLRLIAFAHGADDPEAGGDAPAAAGPAALAAIRRRLSHLLRRLVRDADGFPDLPLDARHGVRKRLKRLRYVAAMIAPLYPDGDVEAWMAALGKAQDTLGEHVDLELAAQRFEDAAAAQPRHRSAVGWLRSQAQRQARACRKALRRLRRAAPFW